jgi:23S rRNA (uridine2552-2'-O)-methyltransferase
MKKVRDHYFKKARKENYPARSVYKLQEVQKKYQVIRKNNTVLDLGCCPGSWSLYAAEIVGSGGRVTGIDLKPVKVKNRTAKWLEFIRGDIFSELNVLAGERVDVVLSDMAPQTSGNKFTDHVKSVELAVRALEICGVSLKSGGNFYCKVFQGEDFPGFVADVKKNFKLVKVVKPKSSRSESREVFVLGMNFRGLR